VTRPSSPPPPPRQQQRAADPADVPWRTIHRRKNDDFLFAEDVGPVGTQIDVEVENSGIGIVTDLDGKTKIPWVSFKGARKKLGLNRSACKALETFYGTNRVAAWRGGWITLVIIRTTYQDRQTKQRVETDAIRIAPRRPTNPRRGRYLNELPSPEPELAAAAADEPEQIDAFAAAAISAEEQAEIEKNERARHEREDA
jgi:hypothetical protein